MSFEQNPLLAPRIEVGVSGKVKLTGSVILKVLGKLFPHALKATTVNVPPVAPGPAVTVKLVPEAIPENEHYIRESSSIMG